MRTHGALTEDSVSRSLNDHIGNGREGKWKGIGRATATLLVVSLAKSFIQPKSLRGNE